jgi:glycosyl transferase family 25
MVSVKVKRRINTLRKTPLSQPQKKIIPAPRRLLSSQLTTRLHTRRIIREDVINHKNRMAGKDAVNATGPPITVAPLAWPSEIKAAFAISMRTQRWQGMQARLGSWANRVKLWNATNGNSISVRSWIAQKKTVSTMLTRGQLGCYDSHVRLWRHIVKMEIPLTLIMEDDANVRHHPSTLDTMTRALEGTKKVKPDFDLLYLGRQRSNDISRYNSLLVRPRGCCGLFAYILTLSGAKKLIQKCDPYRVPVDVLVGQLSDQGFLHCVAVTPRMCWVVPVRSDTAGIK